MKTARFLWTTLMVLGIFGSPATAQLTQSTTPTPPKSELTLLEAHLFKLTNLHRPDAVLQFTLHGPNITGIPEHSFAEIWRIKLSDGSDIFIDRVQSKLSPQSTEYHFHWYGENGTIDREVCFDYGRGSWYSGYEEKNQSWPMDTGKVIPKGHAFTTGDFFSGHFGSVVEYLFLNSDGFALFLEDLDAWFLRRDPNAGGGQPQLCLAVDSNRFPYRKTVDNKYFHLEFRMIAATNIREAHQAVMKRPGWIPKPKSIPDEIMFTQPIWSTWAQYHKEINQSTVLAFANEIKHRGFAASQIEIDDLWEAHYGDSTFDQQKFPNAKALVDAIHKLGYRVTLWAYPFVNADSTAFNESEPHLTRNTNGNLAGVSWWNGLGGIIDFSNQTAVSWFINRLKALQNVTGLDSFKFDAGELSWYGSQFYFDDEIVANYPNLITYRYAYACAEFGKLIEVRSAFRTQDLPIFVRMLDKNSQWSVNNGLKSLITTALTMSLAGYSFILPDMIGGNAYNGQTPSEELYIRWLQANTFLPSMQLSIPPWIYSERAVNLTKQFINLHVQHAPTIIALAKRVQFGEPIIRPMWYAAPEDAGALTVADQFLVGEDLLVAPVVDEGAVSRKVYFPPGDWIDEHGQVWSGPAVKVVKAPLETLPYFKRKH